MSIKKLSNTIISEVYHQILKVECDELIDLDEYDDNRITIYQLKSDIEIRNSIYLRFYHLTTYNLLKQHLGIDIEKPIVFIDDLRNINKIKSQLYQLISDDEWEIQKQLIRDIDDGYYYGLSLTQLSKEYNFNRDKIKKYLRLSDNKDDIRIEYLKEFKKRDFQNKLNELSYKLKWGRSKFFNYYKPTDSYIIEFLDDGYGLIYDSIKSHNNEELEDGDYLIIDSDIMSELYNKVEKHRVKLNDRIKSYCGWKTKERSFQFMRNKGVSYLNNRIIRYMVVKEYDFDKWNLKLYSDLLHRDIITLTELKEIQIHLINPSYDFKSKIKDVINEVLVMYDYRNKPKVISVDINKFFRIKSKYKSILQHY